jgi:hypothetical protein
MGDWGGACGACAVVGGVEPDGTRGRDLPRASGYHVEVLDPDPLCLARFSRLVRSVHSCPRSGVDPLAYLDVVKQVVGERRIDVVFPTHEQAWLFAAAAPLFSRLPIAAADIASFGRVQSKVEFARLLDEVGLAQPRWRLVGDEDDVADVVSVLAEDCLQHRGQRCAAGDRRAFAYGRHVGTARAGRRADDGAAASQRAIRTGPRFVRSRAPYSGSHERADGDWNRPERRRPPQRRSCSSAARHCGGRGGAQLARRADPRLPA